MRVSFVLVMMVQYLPIRSQTDPPTDTIPSSNLPFIDLCRIRLQIKGKEKIRTDGNHNWLQITCVWSTLTAGKTFLRRVHQFCDPRSRRSG